MTQSLTMNYCIYDEIDGVPCTNKQKIYGYQKVKCMIWKDSLNIYE